MITQVDHVVPSSKGGSDSPANLVPSCKICNRKKGKKDYLDFIEQEIATLHLNLETLEARLEEYPKLLNKIRHTKE